jgi:hypothetical protein
VNNDPRFDADGTPVAPSVAAALQRDRDEAAILRVSFLLAVKLQDAHEALRTEGSPRQSVHRDEIRALASARGVVDGLNKS